MPVQYLTRAAALRTTAMPQSRILPRLPAMMRPTSQRLLSTTSPLKRDPSENRRNSEGTMPGAGSADEIANSEGAYRSDSTRPQEAGKQIEKENPNVDFDSSAASNDNAQRTSPEHDGGKVTSEGKGATGEGSNPPPSKENLGASRKRKEMEKNGK